MESAKIIENIKEALEEVKLHREGKIHLDTWEEYLAKKEQKHEQF